MAVDWEHSGPLAEARGLLALVVNGSETVESIRRLIAPLPDTPWDSRDNRFRVRTAFDWLVEQRAAGGNPLARRVPRPPLTDEDRAQLKHLLLVERLTYKGALQRMPHLSISIVARIGRALGVRAARAKRPRCTAKPQTREAKQTPRTISEGEPLKRNAAHRRTPISDADRAQIERLLCVEKLSNKGVLGRMRHLTLSVIGKISKACGAAHYKSGPGRRLSPETRQKIAGAVAAGLSYPAIQKQFSVNGRTIRKLRRQVLGDHTDRRGWRPKVSTQCVGAN